MLHQQIHSIENSNDLDSLILGFTYKRRGTDIVMEKTRIFKPEQVFPSAVVWGVCVGLKNPPDSGKVSKEYNYLFRAITKRMDVYDSDGDLIPLNEIHNIADRYEILNPPELTAPVPSKPERKNKKVAKGNESDHEANLEEIPADAPRVNIPTADELIQTVERSVEFGESSEFSSRRSA